MNPPEVSELISKHALKNEANLRLAIQVGLAFSHLKEQLIRDFIRALKADLKGRLGNLWQVDDYWSEAPLARHCSIGVRKKQWAGETCIGLGCERNGPSELDWFVWSDHKIKTALSSEIKAALDSKYAVGLKHGAVYPWWKWVEKPYRDWNTEEALVALRKKDHAVEYYGSHLARIAKIAGPLIDRIGKKPK